LQRLGRDPTGGQRVIQPTVPTPELRAQRQCHQRADWPVGAQQRLGQLKQRIRPPLQALVEAAAKLRQPLDGFEAGLVF
jgi:hypothetical protein